MPTGNPLDYLKKAWGFANTPLVNADGAADAIDSPSVERSPMEARVRGFGAGALQGLAGMSTPLNIGMAAMPAMGAMMRGGQAAKRLAPALDLIDTPTPKQVMPGADDVNALIGDLRRNLAKVPSRRPPMETLGEVNPQFTPVGGEGIYNAGQGAAGSGPVDAYQLLLSKLGGRGR